jgi:hypothetical protein
MSFFFLDFGCAVSSTGLSVASPLRMQIAPDTESRN